jgi:hypothetical protein
MNLQMRLPRRVHSRGSYGTDDGSASGGHASADDGETTGAPPAGRARRGRRLSLRLTRVYVTKTRTANCVPTGLANKRLPARGRPAGGAPVVSPSATNTRAAGDAAVVAPAHVPQNVWRTR